MNFQLDYSTKVILRVVLIGLVLAFLWMIRDILMILLMSLVLASAMEPMADYLHKKRIPRFASVLGTYLIVIGAAVLIISLITPLVVSQAKVLSQNLPSYLDQIQNEYPNVSAFLGGLDLKTLANHLLSGLTTNTAIFNRTIGFFNGLFAFVTVLVFSFYIVAADRGMKQLVRDLLPTKHQPLITSLIVKIQNKMGLWVLGQIILSVFIFVLTYIALTLLGVQYALFLALLAGLLEIIPYVGPFLSAIPAVFFALIQNPPLAIGVVLIYILIQKLEGYILVPKVMEKTVGTSPLVVLLALLIGFKLAGILGLLLAVPIAGAITVVIHETLHEKSLKSEA